VRSSQSARSSAAMGVPGHGRSAPGCANPRSLIVRTMPLRQSCERFDLATMRNRSENTTSPAPSNRALRCAPTKHSRPCKPTKPCKPCKPTKSLRRVRRAAWLRLDHPEPQRPEEPAGATLGDGSAGEDFDWTRPVRGPTRTVGRFRQGRMPRRNPPVGARPGPQGNKKTGRVRGPSPAGRRSVAPRVAPAGSYRDEAPAGSCSCADEPSRNELRSYMGAQKTRPEPGFPLPQAEPINHPAASSASAGIPSAGCHRRGSARSSPSGGASCTSSRRRSRGGRSGS